MINTISTALSGLLSASKSVNQSAENIAKAGTGLEETSLIEDIVDIKLGETVFKANIAVLKTADEMSQELLKTFDEEV